MFLFFICSLPLLLLLLDMLHCSLFCTVVVWLVCCFTPCIIIAYCGASPLPYGATIVCCGPSSFTLHYYCLLWCVILRFELLLFVMVHCFHLAMCNVVAIYYVSSSLTLCCYYLLWFVVLHLAFLLVWCVVLRLVFYWLLWCVAFTLCCYYLLWCIVPCLVLLLVVVHRPHLVLLIFVVVCHPLLFVVITYCGALPSSCIVVIRCGLLLLALHCCFVIPCLFLVLTSPSFVLFLLFAMVCFLLCVVACLLKWCTFPPLAMCMF